MGKLVAVPQDPGPPVRPENAATVRADASYLITGGLGGLGLEVARWLLTRGATRIVLAGRNVPPHPASIEAFARDGADIEAVPCDVTDALQVTRIVERLADDAERPLRGIVHAAGVLDDGLLVQQIPTGRAVTQIPGKVGSSSRTSASSGSPSELSVPRMNP